MADLEKNIPDEELEDTVITLTDEETGEEVDFELYARATIDDKTYFALVPCDEESDEYVILRATEDGDDWVTVHTAEDVVCGKRLGSGDPRETYDAYPDSDKFYDVELDATKTARRVRIHITEPSVATVGDDCYMGFGEIEVWGKPAED